MPLLTFNAPEFAPGQVDTVNAIIRGVSVITGGVIARGHDLEVDDTTLRQLMLCAKEKQQVPVKVDHKSGAGAVCGYLQNFHIEGNKLKADWYLLMSHPQKDQILEVAERMPKGVGLSAAFVAPEIPEKAKSGKPAARCQELISVDYVSLPAANPNGMFSAKVDTPHTLMNPTNTAPTDAAAPAQDQAALIQQLQSQLQQLSEQNAALQGQLDLVQNPLTLDEASEMSDEELASHGLTRDDVEKALADAQGEGCDNEGTELATAGAPSDGGSAATGLSTITKAIVELGARLDRMEKRDIRSKEQILFSAINEKVDALSAENEALREAVRTGGKAATPSVDRGNLKFFGRGKNEDAFNQQVSHLVAGGMKKSLAFQQVIKDDPSAYKSHLASRGIVEMAE